MIPFGKEETVTQKLNNLPEITQFVRDEAGAQT